MLYFVSDPSYELHLTGMWHPEQPARTRVICQALEQAGIKNKQNTLSPRMASKEDILLCHSPAYFELAKHEVSQLANDQLLYLSTGDVVVSSKSFDIALLAAGGVLTAIDQVMGQANSKAFCIVRPPGHHATKDRGMGFCLFNNAAIGARYAQKQHGINRVLIVDWDVHHGNGTQDIFYEDPSIFYFSIHEEGNYPNTGFANEIGVGNILNCPIAPGKQSREHVIKAFYALQQTVEAFKPEFIIISAGFDAHKDDPLGHFNLSDEDFGLLTQIVNAIAKKYAKGRVVSVLEGGYNLQALSSATVAHCQALLCDTKDSFLS